LIRLTPVFIASLPPDGDDYSRGEAWPRCFADARRAG
jgi:hypothetical protein